jgi:type IV pilus assembly protein PilC
MKLPAWLISFLSYNLPFGILSKLPLNQASDKSPDKSPDQSSTQPSKKSSKKPFDLSFQLPFISNISFIDKLLFTKHLSMMTKTDTTILEALDILASLAESRAFKKIIKQILEDIKNGKSLSESMAKNPKVFDAFYTNIIAIGETSGTLEKSFTYLSIQLAKEYAFRKIVQGAMIYPVIVLIAVGGVGMGVSIFVLPKLLDLFTGFGVNLPWTTKILIAFASLMQNAGGFVITGLIVIIILIRIILKLRLLKPYVDRIFFEIPFFGKIVKNAEATIFCRNLGTLLKSGIPINSALVIVLKISTNFVIQESIIYLLGATEKGKSLGEEFDSHHFKYFPPLMTKMIAIGEKTGNLSDTLLYLSDFFEEEVNNAMKNISTLLEPVMLLVIGALVAFIALAIISPLYQLTGSVGGH